MMLSPRLKPFKPWLKTLKPWLKTLKPWIHAQNPVTQPPIPRWPLNLRRWTIDAGQFRSSGSTTCSSSCGHVTVGVYTTSWSTDARGGGSEQRLSVPVPFGSDSSKIETL